MSGNIILSTRMARFQVSVSSAWWGNSSRKIEGFYDQRGDDRGWDGWMASQTRWTWVWVNSGRWWWTGRSGVLRFMGSQRVRHDWATELNWWSGILVETLGFVICSFGDFCASIKSRIVWGIHRVPASGHLKAGWEDKDDSWGQTLWLLCRSLDKTNSQGSSARLCWWSNRSPQISVHKRSDQR